MPSRSVTVFAPAKLNLYLELLGKRADGFHELETLMVAVDPFDTVVVTEEEHSQIRLEVRQRTAGEGESIPTGSQNLVFKAAALLRDFAGVRRGVRIDLTKRIPVAAGLAGGSSDAAATLIALDRLWNLNLPAECLSELAARLGSDLNFFLEGQPAAVCRGRGELVHRVALPAGLHFVVCRPETGLATAAVFARCRVPDVPRRINPLVAALSRGRLDRAGRLLHNSLQPAAIELNPDLSETLTSMGRMPFRGTAMSGSGTACYGLCSSARQARTLAARLNATRSTAFAASMIGHRTLPGNSPGT